MTSPPKSSRDNGVARRFAIPLLIVFLCSGWACSDTQPVSRTEALAAKRLGVRAVRIVELRLPPPFGSSEAAPNTRSAEISIPLGEKNVAISLVPFSLRAKDCVALVPTGQGFKRWPLPPPTTVRGAVRELSGSAVVGSLSAEGLTVTIRMPDGQRWEIQPLRAVIENADPRAHIVYRDDELKPLKLECANVSETNGESWRPLSADALSSRSGGSQAGLHYAEIAIESDIAFYRGTVDGTIRYIEETVSGVDEIYAREVEIGYIITAFVIRNQQPEPYSTTDPAGLLDQFEQEWNAYHKEIPRDVAHLLTGRDLDGLTSGISNTGTICDRSKAYGLSGNQIIDPSYRRRVNLMAHELGHGWNASHCDGDPCYINIMNRYAPAISSSFWDGARAEIIHYRDSVACLDHALVFVDWRADGPFLGTELNPFAVLADGINAAPWNGTVIVRGPHLYTGGVPVGHAVTIRAQDGPVTIRP